MITAYKCLANKAIRIAAQSINKLTMWSLLIRFTYRRCQLSPAFFQNKIFCLVYKKSFCIIIIGKVDGDATDCVMLYRNQFSRNNVSPVIFFCFINKNKRSFNPSFWHIVRLLRFIWTIPNMLNCLSIIHIVRGILGLRFVLINMLETTVDALTYDFFRCHQRKQKYTYRWVLQREPVCDYSLPYLPNWATPDAVFDLLLFEFFF